MILILLFTSIFAFADAPHHWSHILEVGDKHEFYKSHENIEKPMDAWQTLFSLIYLDTDLNRLKDCVFYRVPGKEPGILKVKTIGSKESCESFLLSDGEKEVTNIKNFQFAIYDKLVALDFSTTDFKIQKWEAEIQNAAKKEEPSMLMSSAEYKSAKIIYLAPKVSNKVLAKTPLLKDKTLCHDINEDCEEKSPSQCSSCETDFYEVPNGCESGPKYCGTYKCGGKAEPACRRGIMWQKLDDEFDCRTNSTFAFCSKGLQIVCEGRKAFCR